MNAIVTKFGGSSLSDAGQFRKVAEILHDNPQRRFAVASAPGKRNSKDIKVTDLLYRCFDLASKGDLWKPVFEHVRDRYTEIISEIVPSFSLESEFRAIEEHLSACPQRDYVASRGEYLNSRILAAYLGWDFIDAADIIRFDENGNLDEKQTKECASKALESARYAVIPGFYGSKPDGTIVTFSRGGSDITGSLVAWAADAVEYENWTDVSGMLFTDPRIVNDPRSIEYITYRELRELSYMGASVLHEDAVFPVRKAGIPIHICNTNRPSDPGTRIVANLPGDYRMRTVTGVAGKKGFCSIQVEKSMMNGEVGFGATLLSIFAENGVSFEHCPTGIDTMSVLVNEEEYKSKQATVLTQIQERLCPEIITVENDIALIAVVGHGMVASRGCAARIFRTVADAGINIRMIDQGSSELNIILGVNEIDFEEAIRCIYREFR